MRCVIFSGADIHDYDFVASFLSDGDFIICADSGLRHAKRLGLTADLLIGDLDSADKARLDGYSRLIKLPCEKDDTDTFAAAKIASENDYDSVIIFGAIGSRVDHSLGNIATLEYLHECGISAKLVDQNNEICIISNETVKIKKHDGCFISLIPLDKTLSGVSITGVKYPLNNAEINRASTLTISNEILDEFAEITVGNGTALYILSRD